MRILLITYSFPPSTRISAQRWFKLCSESTNSNLNFTIITANWKGEKIVGDNIHYLGEQQQPIISKSIVGKPSILDLIKHPTIYLRTVSRTLFSSWIRVSKNWIDIHKKDKYDIIIASYGPISSLIIGNYAKSIYNCPLILDLRDLISIQGQKKQIPVFHQIDKFLDQFFCRKVDLFTTVSPTCKLKSEKFYKRPVKILYNGFKNEISCDVTKKFTKKNINILYAGTLGEFRNPRKIIEIISSFSKKNLDWNISINFASQDNPFDYLSKTLLNRLKIYWLGYLNKDDLNDYYSKSDAFLLIEDQEPKGDENLTGKIYEYMNQNKPIMASCSKTSDIIKILKETNSGGLIDNYSSLEQFLKKEWIIKKEKVNKYSVKNQIEVLCEILTLTKSIS